MSNQRKGGVIFLKTDSELLDAKGEFTYNLGQPKREAIVGADQVHGYTETPQVAFIEGEVTDSNGLNVEKMVNTTDATITLELANGKVFVLRNAWFAGDANIGTGQGNIAVRFEGMRGEEVRG